MCKHLCLFTGKAPCAELKPGKDDQSAPRTHLYAVTVQLVTGQLQAIHFLSTTHTLNWYEAALSKVQAGSTGLHRLNHGAPAAAMFTAHHNRANQVAESVHWPGNAAHPQPFPVAVAHLLAAIGAAPRLLRTILLFLLLLSHGAQPISKALLTKRVPAINDHRVDQ